MTEKTIIITGANRGIGRASVRAFAEKGYDIWACARAYSEAFEADMAGEAARTGAGITPVYFDLLKEDEVRSGVQRILSGKRDVDVLLNCAGIPYNGLLTMTPLDKLREVYQVNVFAQVQLIQLIARRMMRRKRGCIINLCSAGGIEAAPGYLAYGSSKAAMIWITRCAARELGQYHIRVNGIAPGLIDTDMGAYKPEEEREKLLERTCLGRLGRPEEIAAAAVYLASEDAAFMTGQIMVLDGGRV